RPAAGQRCKAAHGLRAAAAHFPETPRGGCAGITPLEQSRALWAMRDVAKRCIFAFPERENALKDGGANRRYPLGQAGGFGVAGFGRIVLVGATIAVELGAAALHAQTALEDPKNAPKIFANTCSACHTSPQGLAKSGGTASFLRQHHQTG